MVVRNIILKKADAVSIHTFFLQPLLSEGLPFQLLRIDFLLQLDIAFENVIHFFF